METRKQKKSFFVKLMNFLLVFQILTLIQVVGAAMGFETSQMLIAGLGEAYEELSEASPTLYAVYVLGHLLPLPVTLISFFRRRRNHKKDRGGNGGTGGEPVGNTEDIERQQKWETEREKIKDHEPLYSQDPEENTAEPDETAAGPWDKLHGILHRDDAALITGDGTYSRLPAKISHDAAACLENVRSSCVNEFSRDSDGIRIQFLVRRSGADRYRQDFLLPWEEDGTASFTDDGIVYRFSLSSKSSLTEGAVTDPCESGEEVATIVGDTINGVEQIVVLKENMAYPIGYEEDGVRKSPRFLVSWAKGKGGKHHA